MKQKKNIKSLTSLRFIAALGVFFSHAGVIGTSDIPLAKTLANYFFYGYTGVTFFYILSGFIISYSYHWHKVSGKYDLADFMIFRVSRLFPVHILSICSLFIVFGLYNHLDSINYKTLISNLTLTQSFVPDKDYYFSFNAVSWSISCEMFFYIAFCLLSKLRTSYILAITAFSLLINIYMATNGKSELSDHWLFYINPIFRLSDFMIGVLIARLYMKLSWKPGVAAGTSMEILSIASLAITILIASGYVDNMNIKYDLMFIPAMMMIVLSFSFDSGLISKVLSARSFILLGDASFSLYMFHWIIMEKSKLYFDMSFKNADDIVYFVSLNFVMSVFVSVIVYKAFETPINKFIRNKWTGFRYKKSDTYQA